MFLSKWLNYFFLYFFGGLRTVCWPLHCLCRPFCIFQRCLDSNPECCRSKKARYQLIFRTNKIDLQVVYQPQTKKHLELDQKVRQRVPTSEIIEIWIDQQDVISDGVRYLLRWSVELLCGAAEVESSAGLGDDRHLTVGLVLQPLQHNKPFSLENNFPYKA